MGVSQVKSASVTATGTVVSGVARIVAIAIQGDAVAASTVVLRDGGASGTVKTTLGTSIGSDITVELPPDGMRFETDVHATVTAADRVTIFYI